MRRAPVTRERAWENALRRRIVTPGGCWRSTYRSKNSGYAELTLEGRLILVHRLAVMVALDTDRATLDSWCDDKGRQLQVDHLCCVRTCFNPLHLDLVPVAVNCQRGSSPASKHAKRARCPRGHQLGGDNADHLTPGQRNCLTCRLVRQRIATRVKRGVARPTDWASVEQEVLRLLAQKRTRNNGKAA